MQFLIKYLLKNYSYKKNLTLFEVNFLTCILTSIILIIVVSLYFKRKKQLPLPPGPYGVPFLGFLPFLGQDFHLTLTNLAKSYGPLFQIFLGNNRIVVINDPAIIREAFRKSLFAGRPSTEMTKILKGYGKLKII